MLLSITECVLSYIDTKDVNKLLLSLSSLSPSFLVLYDPIIPNTDGYFGTMIKGFSERGAPLLHISKSRKQHLGISLHNTNTTNTNTSTTTSTKILLKTC